MFDRSILALFLSVLVLVGSSARAAPMFIPLADLPGSNPTASVTDVSADGSILVGSMAVNAFGVRRTFRGSIEGGLELLDSGGVLGTSSSAAGVSADGSIVVGNRRGTLGPEAFRWDAQGGAVGLGDLFGGNFNSTAYAISGDGSVIVGQAESGAGRQAFRYTDERPRLVGLAEPSAPVSPIRALDVSADGSVIVGEGGAAVGTEAFRREDSTGAIGIGHLPGLGRRSLATAISSDGMVIVGQSTSSNIDEAFRWDADNEMVGLGVLPGGRFGSTATGVSGDGSIVVGRSSFDQFDRAFIWDEEKGMRALSDEFSALGISVPEGWLLLAASGISDDGSVIYGGARNEFGQDVSWIAVLPEPGTGLLMGCGLIAMAMRQRTRRAWGLHA